jgi:hypothetical protein
VSGSDWPAANPPTTARNRHPPRTTPRGRHGPALKDCQPVRRGREDAGRQPNGQRGDEDQGMIANDANGDTAGG